MPSTTVPAGTDADTGDIDAAAGPLRAALAGSLAEQGLLDDPAWRRAVQTVPRHRFAPGGSEPAVSGHFAALLLSSRLVFTHSR